MSGLFVTIEGIDASGKSSTVAQVVEALNERGYDATQITRKDVPEQTPYIHAFMKQFKEIFWKYNNDDPLREMPDECWLFMHALWYQLLDQYHISPMKAQNKIVVIDAWYYKILARFMTKEHFNKTLLHSIFSGLQTGDAVFLLHADPAICWSRRTSFSKPELGEFDNHIGDARERFVSFQSKVSETYLKLAAESNWNVLHTDQLSRSQIVHTIADRISEIKAASTERSHVV